MNKEFCIPLLLFCLTFNISKANQCDSIDSLTAKIIYSKYSTADDDEFLNFSMKLIENSCDTLAFNNMWYTADYIDTSSMIFYRDPSIRNRVSNYIYLYFLIWHISQNISYDHSLDSLKYGCLKYRGEIFYDYQPIDRSLHPEYSKAEYSSFTQYGLLNHQSRIYRVQASDSERVNLLRTTVMRWIENVKQYGLEEVRQRNLAVLPEEFTFCYCPIGHTRNSFSPLEK